MYIYDRFLFSWSETLFDVEEFELYVRVFAEMTSDGRFYNNLLSPGIILHVVHEGLGTVECRQQKEIAGPGTLFVFWPEEDIKYYDSSDSPWKYTWFWLYGKSARKILKMIGIGSEKRVYNISECNSFLDNIDTVTRCFKEKNYSSCYAARAAWELLDTLMEELSDKDSLAGIVDMAQEFIILIENTPLSRVNVNTIAKHLNVDRSTLFRVFKDSTGISPKEYIDRFRLDKSCMLLADKHLSIKEIAIACGFKDQCYFSAVFRKHFDMSPSQWRQK